MSNADTIKTKREGLSEEFISNLLVQSRAKCIDLEAKSSIFRPLNIPDPRQQIAHEVYLIPGIDVCPLPCFQRQGAHVRRPEKY